MAQLEADSTEANQNGESKFVLKFTRLKLRELCNALKTNAETNQSPIKSFNSQVTAGSSSRGASIQPLRIINLNPDCLKHIFRGLNLEDLTNVAGSCVTFNEAAHAVFRGMFRDHEVLIDCDQYPVYKVTSKSQLSHQRLFCGRNIVDFFKFLGKVISKLIIRNMCTTADSDFGGGASRSIERFLMSDDVRKHLIEIKFQNCREAAISKAKPFEKVAKVTFERCIIKSTGANSISDFEYLFPCMRKLELIDCNVENSRKCIEKQFSQLRTLNVSVPFDVNAFANLSFTAENIKAAIDQNPNIQHLSLCYWNATAYDGTLLQYAALNLPFLKTLHLWHFRFTEFQTAGDILFTSVRKFILSNHYHAMGLLDRNLSRLSFDGLTKFCILDRFDSECTTFVARHKTIRKLVIFSTGQHEYYPTNSDIIRLGTVLPNLQRLIVSGNRLTALGLLRFISECKSLWLVIIRQHKFSKVIRNLFQCRCNELGWTAAHGFRDNKPEFILRRNT